MKLIEIFNQLTHGELSQLCIGGAAEGEISEANYDKVLAHINLGLAAIFKRFPLKEGKLQLALVPGRLTYPLTSLYATSNTRSKEPVRFILDSAGDKFQDDLLKIESVHTDGGKDLAINDLHDPYSLTTPGLDILRIPRAIVDQDLQLPEEYRTQQLAVTYRAGHPVVSQGYGSFNPETYEVSLPYSYLEPLLYFVASRMHTPVGVSNETMSGNNYAAKYEMACQQLEQYGLKIDPNNGNDRLTRNGWV